MSDHTYPSGFTVTIEKREVDSVVARLKHYYKSEFGRQYDDSTLSSTLAVWIDRIVDDAADDLGEILTSPHREESREFRSILEENANFREAPEIIKEEERNASSVFSGNRAFSAERLGAMMAYIARKGENIYKTKLNKLLFYSDFINFHLQGRSISGATYSHLPFGPVPQQYEEVLDGLQQSGAVNLARVGSDATLIQPSVETAQTKLSAEEIGTINWVLENYGMKSTGEISDQSHREMAYRFTRPGEIIAYRYAQFFEHLPELREYHQCVSAQK
ncbi:MAG: Panacea domain-containing protein [Pyrinomonadaceae bacterium]